MNFWQAKVRISAEICTNVNFYSHECWNLRLCAFSRTNVVPKFRDNLRSKNNSAIFRRKGLIPIYSDLSGIPWFSAGNQEFCCRYRGKIPPLVKDRIGERWSKCLMERTPGEQPAAQIPKQITAKSGQEGLTRDQVSGTRDKGPGIRDQVHRGPGSRNQVHQGQGSPGPPGTRNQGLGTRLNKVQRSGSPGTRNQAHQITPGTMSQGPWHPHHLLTFKIWVARVAPQPRDFFGKWGIFLRARETRA